MEKKILVLFVFCLLVAVAVAEHCTSCYPLNFKENKGQWETQIRFKAELKNGAAFFEENAITFNLFDTRDVLRIKGDHHKMENFEPTIDYTMHYHAFKLQFLNANLKPQIQPASPIEEYFNYFIGNDKATWASKVRGYEEVNYREIYSGIDFKIIADKGQMKYIYEVKSNSDFSQIKTKIVGANQLTMNERGDLVIHTSVGDLIDTKPYAYQIVNGKEVEVSCQFVLKNEVLSYAFPNGYNKAKPLFIDPTLVFSTYSGSTADNFGYSATYDSKGNAFAAGSSFGTGYPVTVGAYQMTYVGGPTITFSNGGTYPGADIGITKYNATGTQRIYSTYLGGFGQDLPHSLVVNALDELYILGTTSSSSYPTTGTAYDKTYNGGSNPGVFDGIAAHYSNGSDIVISRLSVDGSQLLSSTYVGGSENDGLNYRAGQPYSTPGFTRHNYADEVRGEIDIDKNNNVYVASCTRSADFPRSASSFQNTFGGGLDACVFKMDADLSTMIWSTTFGGSDDDAAYSVAIDASENLFLAGGTRSTNFPATAGALQTANAGGETDGFVTHIDKNGQINIASTYYGYGDYDQIYFVDLDKQNNVYVFGQADNSASLYIKNALYSKPNGGQFISKLNNNLSNLEWSTSFGRGLGVTDISPTAFLVDVCNSIYACGWGSQGTNSIVGGSAGTTGMDVTSNAFKATTDGQDFYLMVLKDDASALTYATFMGGNISGEHVDGGTSRFDRKGVVYQSVCAGCGSNDDFPTTAGAVSNTNNSNNCNNAVFKFNLDLPTCLADFTSPNACQNTPIVFTNLSTSQNTPDYEWYFGDGSFSFLDNPTHVYAQTGLFDVTLIVKDPTSCNGSDTITKSILVIGTNGTDTLPTQTICSTQSIQIGLPPSSDPSVTYQWTPANNLSSATVSNPIASPTESTTYTLLVSNGVCIDSVKQTILIFTDALTVQGDDVLCPGDTLQLQVTNNQPNQQLTFSWQPMSQIISGGNTATPLVSPVQNTTYIVTATNSIGCVFTDSIRIDVLSSLPGVDAVANPDTITFGDSTQLDLIQLQNVVSINWQAHPTLSATTIAHPTAKPTQTTTYYVEVADSQGCRKRDSVVVVVLKTPCESSNIFIPNGFSPNGDGKNDVLYLRGNNISNIYFVVYDRWGQKVFESRELAKGWDGMYKGKQLDPAVFAYYAEGECVGGEQFFVKGNVTLIR